MQSDKLGTHMHSRKLRLAAEILTKFSQSQLNFGDISIARLRKYVTRQKLPKAKPEETILLDG